MVDRLGFFIAYNPFFKSFLKVFFMVFLGFFRLSLWTILVPPCFPHLISVDFSVGSFMGFMFILVFCFFKVMVGSL